MSLARKWMELEDIMLSKLVQTENDRYYMLSLIHETYKKEKEEKEEGLFGKWNGTRGREDKERVRKDKEKVREDRRWVDMIKAQYLHV
jgi:hypothetical protein